MPQLMTAFNLDIVLLILPSQQAGGLDVSVPASLINQTAVINKLQQFGQTFWRERPNWFVDCSLFDAGSQALELSQA